MTETRWGVTGWKTSQMLRHCWPLTIGIYSRYYTEFSWHVELPHSQNDASLSGFHTFLTRFVAVANLQALIMVCFEGWHLLDPTGLNYWLWIHIALALSSPRTALWFNGYNQNRLEQAPHFMCTAFLCVRCRVCKVRLDLMGKVPQIQEQYATNWKRKYLFNPMPANRGLGHYRVE